MGQGIPKGAGGRRIAGMEYERQDKPGGWVTWVATEGQWQASVTCHPKGYFSDVFVMPLWKLAKNEPLYAAAGLNFLDRAFPLLMRNPQLRALLHWDKPQIRYTREEWSQPLRGYSVMPSIDTTESVLNSP